MIHREKTTCRFDYFHFTHSREKATADHYIIALVTTTTQTASKKLHVALVTTDRQYTGR